MPGRRDWPYNSMNEAPWTLDITSNTAFALNPTTDAQAGELPARSTGFYDVRHCRGYSAQIVVAGNTVQTSAAVVELQWSNDGINSISMGSAYQATLAASALLATYGFIVLNPFYSFVRMKCITAGGASSTAAGTKIFWLLRD